MVALIEIDNPPVNELVHSAGVTGDARYVLRFDVATGVPDDYATVSQRGGSVYAHAFYCGMFLSVDYGNVSFFISSQSTKSDSTHRVELALPMASFAANTNSVEIEEVDSLNVEMVMIGMSSNASCSLRSAGTARVAIREILSSGSTTAKISFSTSQSIYGELIISNAVVLDAATRREVGAVTFYTDDALRNETAHATTVLSSLAEQIMDFRSLVAQYASCPNLTKPYNQKGNTRIYDTISGIMERPTGISADGLESLLSAALAAELHRHNHDLDGFVVANRTPTLYTSPLHEQVVAVALNRVVRILFQYVEDNAIWRHRSGNTTEAVECWPDRPILCAALMDGDCDDSSEMMMRVLRQIGVSPFGKYDDHGTFMSPSPDFDPERHVVTTAIRCALHNYICMLAVVGAASFSGADAAALAADGAHSSPKTTCGHAIVLLLEKARFLSMVEAGYHTYNGHYEDNYETTMGSYYDCLFGGNQLLSLPPEERADVASCQLVLEAQRDGEWNLRRVPYSIDGTVLCVPDLVPLAPAAAAMPEKALVAIRRLGRVLADIDQDLRRVDNKSNVSYSTFLQHLVSVHIGGVLEHLPAQMVAVRASPGYSDKAVVLQAGVDIYALAQGDAALIPSGSFTRAARNAMATLAKNHAVRAMPPPAPARICAALEEQLLYSLRQLSKLTEELARRSAETARANARGPQKRQTTRLDLYIPPRALILNPGFVDDTIATVEKCALSGKVNVYDIENILFRSDRRPALYYATIAIAVEGA